MSLLVDLRLYPASDNIVHLWALLCASGCDRGDGRPTPLVPLVLSSRGPNRPSMEAASSPACATACASVATSGNASATFATAAAVCNDNDKMHVNAPLVCQPVPAAAPVQGIPSQQTWNEGLSVSFQGGPQDLLTGDESRDDATIPTS